MSLTKERKFGVGLGYMAIALRNILSLLLIPFIIHHIGASHYGIYSLVTALSGYLIILELGLSNTTIRFLSKYQAENNEQAQQEFMGTILCIYAAITLFVLLFGAVIWWYLPQLFGESLSLEEIALLKPAFLILLINVSITLMSNSFTGIISACERFIFQKSSEIVIFILRCCLVVTALMLNYDLLSIVIIDTIANAIHALSRIVFVRYKLNFPITFKRPSRETLKEILLYTFFIALNVIVNQINWRVDTLIVGTLTSSVTLAVFNIGSQLIFSFIAFASTISNVFTPKIVKLVTKQASNEELTTELIAIGRLQMLVLGFVLSAFIAFGETFVELFVGREFIAAYWVALIPMIPFTFVLAQTSTNAILQAKNKHKIRSLLLLVTALFNIVLSIVLVKNVGMLGAAIGTAATLVIGELILVNIYLHRVIKLNMLHFYWVMLTKAIPVILITTLIALQLKQILLLTWISLMVNCVILAFVYLTVAYFLLLEHQERLHLRNSLNRLFYRNIR